MMPMEPRVYIVSEAGRERSETAYRWRCDDCDEHGPWTLEQPEAEEGRYWHVRDHSGYVDILDG